MRAVEHRAFAQGVAPEALMDEAGARIALAVQQFHPTPGRCTVHFGKGHNGGDALVAARWLAAAGWAVQLAPAFPREQWAPLTERKFTQLPASVHAPQELGLRPRGPAVVLDGLLGLGSSGPLREPILSAVHAIHRARLLDGARVFAIDLPSGLDADSGAACADAVSADVTLTIGFPKRGLVADTATQWVGRLAVLPLAELTARVLPQDPPQETIATPFSLRPIWPPRRFDLHKGDCGRVAIVAGSPGMTGAASLAARACVHAGAGLVTLYATPDIEPRLAVTTPPEVMVRAVDDYREVLGARHDVLAIGPGLGSRHRDQILALLRETPMPAVVDADALNALALEPELLVDCAGPRLLTPHPGEMRRLDPEAVSLSRSATALRFTARYPHTLLLKGARTIVAKHGLPLSYNSTGCPGMASGGMGDTLTGVCAALIAQGLSCYDAARLGAWICGRAAEFAAQRASEEALTASLVIDALGQAFTALRSEGV